MDNIHFGNVSLLITHYNRSQSLQRLLHAFDTLKVSFAEIIISDDCSKTTHLSELRKLAKQFPCKLITTPQNGGLGHNINKGQAAITSPYTLYVQEDFVPTDMFPVRLQNALEMMETDLTIDYTRFYAYIPYPYIKPANQFGFSEMYLPLLGLRYKKIYQYSDHPHLRRSSFIQKFGKYKEGVNVDRAEYGMCISFLQKKGKGFFYNDFKALFQQHNTSSEPSTISRRNWKNSSNPIIKLTRDLYRQVKYNWDIYS
jgi:glycosyltransferase involved in cell wall biosynthesis